LDIDISFVKEAKFVCPPCGAADCPVCDARSLTWRHLNFWQHQTYLNARVPRVRCDACGVKKVSVPWARDGSGFTLLFESHVMDLIPAMPVAAAARMVGEHDTRLWRIIHHSVAEARSRADHRGISRMAFDETAARRGHDYVSLFVNLDRSQVLFVAEGKDAATLGAFADGLTKHGGDPQQVSEVRREEQKSRPELKKTRYAWLKNEANLSSGQRETIHSLARRNLKTARAYQIRLTFQEFYQQPSRQDAKTFLGKGYFWATHSRLQPMIDAAKTVKRHWDGILRWHDTHIANGILEAINSLVQAAKAKARGYRTSHNLKALIYLVAGKLDRLHFT
jgi:transposase